MLLDLINSGFNTSLLIQILLSIPVILLAFSVHESAHGISANMLGDPTARNLGRITLNPAKHLDLYGTLAMLFFGFGWAKPVPINTRNMKNGKWGFVLSALAGPFSNLLLAFIFALLFQIVFVALTYIVLSIEVSAAVIDSIRLFFIIGIRLNASLAVFNMLPVPPLDGSRLLTALLPRKWAMFLFKYEQMIMIGLFVVLYMGAFSGILSTAINAVTDFIISATDLIPFYKMYNVEGFYKMF